MHSVAILAYDGMSGFESGLAAEIFGMTELSAMFSSGLPQPWYSVKLCSETPDIGLVGGATVRTSYGLDDLAAADTVVIPSVRDVAEPMSPDLLDAIRAADDRQARLVSICSGAFALAAAGVLDGRAATTHWIYVDLLRAQYPDVDIDPAPLYVDNGRVLTSAGCAAGLDLCLHIVRSDHGVRVANDVARRLVISPHRAGGQAQYIDTPVPEPTTDGQIAAGMAWALASIFRPWWWRSSCAARCVANWVLLLWAWWDCPVSPGWAGFPSASGPFVIGRSGAAGHPKAVRMRCQAVAICEAHRQVASIRSRSWRAPWVMRAATCRTR